MATGDGPQPLKPAGPARAMTVEERAWADQADKLELEALSGIRGLAEKWAASLTTALGIAGLGALFESAGKFDKLGGAWKAVAKISFSAAVVLALTATVLATTAAQGTTKRLFIPGGSALREYSRRAVASALVLLKWSRISAVLAALGLLVAGYCLWFGTHAQGSATVIELPKASQFCPSGTATGDAAKSDADIVVRCGH